MEDEKKMTDEALRAVSGGNRTPGMECPRCKEFIATTIQQIISSGSIVCPHCGLRLTIDK